MFSRGDRFLPYYRLSSLFGFEELEVLCVSRFERCFWVYKAVNTRLIVAYINQQTHKKNKEIKEIKSGPEVQPGKGGHPVSGIFPGSNPGGATFF